MAELRSSDGATCCDQPPAQDGEREKLCNYLASMRRYHDESIARDAVEVRGIVASIDGWQVMLRADAIQSVELANLRAQVSRLTVSEEGLRHAITQYLSDPYWNRDARTLVAALELGTSDKLAPPQPVAKETKP